jgi:hypothetical protein
MKSSHLLLSVSTVLLLSGCAQKETAKVLEPAAVSGAADTKNIAVTPFQHDYANLADKIEAAISKQRIDDRPCFNLISRSDLSVAIDEQKRQNSGLTDGSAAAEAAKLLGAEAIIAGSVDVPSMHDDYYYVKRTKCQSEGKERQCWEAKVSCDKRTVFLSAQIRMIDILTGRIIYAENASRQQQWDHCADDTRALPSKLEATQQLADIMADTFAYKLAPHYRQVSDTQRKESDSAD